MTGAIAGAAVLVIVLAIMIQIVGRPLGFNLVGMVEIANYAMIAATFVALPYTLASRGHIRVLVLVNRLQGRARWIVEIICFVLALLFSAYFFYYCVDLTVASYLRGAREQGMLAAPLWIPQALMTLGVLAFAIGLGHGLAKTLRGQMDLARDESDAL